MMTPERAGVTREQLLADQAPSRIAGEYAWEYFLQHGDAALPDLPIGLQRLVWIIRLVDGINGEGFRGHLGNVTTDDGSIDESLTNAIDSLRTFGADAAVRIATTAVREWTDRLPGWQSIRQRGDDPDFASYEALSWQLDKKWYVQQDGMFAAIDTYIKAHPDEFVHP